MRDVSAVTLMKELRWVSDEGIAEGIAKVVPEREFKNAIDNMGKYRIPLQKVVDPKA
ncbi:MAG: hypothetical protein HY801_11660 [Candidatus Lindowbacteria bacterium]|nr:hypothetical protein [Candidatus Lindowbacteria bacterium]